MLTALHFPSFLGTALIVEAVPALWLVRTRAQWTAANGNDRSDWCERHLADLARLFERQAPLD